MTGPHWQAVIVSVFVIASGVVALARITGTLTGTRGADALRHGQVDVDICHGLMVIAMLGMLLPVTRLTAGRPASLGWLVVFAICTVWFIGRAVRFHSTEECPHGRHFAGHAMLAFAMVYMFAADRAQPGHGSLSAMAMGTSTPALPWHASLAVLLLGVCCVYAAVLLGQIAPSDGEAAGGEPNCVDRIAGEPARAHARGSLLVQQRVQDSAHVVMTLSMAYMFAMMLAG